MSEEKQFQFDQPYEWQGDNLRLELLQPVEFGGDVVHELVFHPLKGSDFFDLPTGSMKLGELTKLASSSTRVPTKVFAEMSPQDFLAVMAVIDVFFAGGRKTQ